MRCFLYLILVISVQLVACTNVGASEGTLQQLEARIDSLRLVRATLEDSLANLIHIIESLEMMRRDLQTMQDTSLGVLVTLRKEGKFRKAASFAAPILATLPKGASVVATDWNNGYFKVRCGHDIGYLNDMYLDRDERLENLIRVGRERQAHLDGQRSVAEHDDSAASQSQYAPASISPRSRFMAWALSETAVTDIAFAGENTIFVTLAPSRYTTKENVAAIARQLARACVMQTGVDFATCKVYWGRQVFAEGKFDR